MTHTSTTIVYALFSYIYTYNPLLWDFIFYMVSYSSNVDISKLNKDIDLPEEKYKMLISGI